MSMATTASQRRFTLSHRLSRCGCTRLFRVTLERGTHVEITPEPTHEERAAILAALDRIRAGDERRPGAWWEAGLRESLIDEAKDE